MRVYNFSPGPAVIDECVLKRAASELVEYGGDGMSVMEMSHRSPMFETIHFNAMNALRRLMNIPENYDILFLQGGATLQFAMVPMNLMQKGIADYVVTGSFAEKAAEEAQKYGTVNVVASSADKAHSYIPELKREMFDVDADYVHITTNNTIYGTSCRTNIPDTGDIPLVADMSSNILSEEYDCSKFGLIYAGAQKNIGPAGLTVVIIRKDLIRADLPKYVPTMCSYYYAAKNDSMYNTPPTYGIYMAGLVFEHLEQIGGVKAMQTLNEKKAKILYDALDNSSIMRPLAQKEFRSMMNVTFVSPDKETDARFISQAADKGLVNLKGHRVLGGMRASIYNAMPVEGVEALADFITKFK